MELVSEAIAFAVKAHDGMRRKKSEAPYILHPMEAAVIVGTIKVQLFTGTWVYKAQCKGMQRLSWEIVMVFAVAIQWVAYQWVP